MVAADLHRRPTLDTRPARELLEAVTAKRPALIARLVAAEPRTTPAVVRRKPRRRPVMKLPRLTKPDLLVAGTESAWAPTPSVVPLVIAALLLGVLAVIFGIR